MLFDERTMQYFQVIARERNISRAAKKLYISQPSLSRFLTKLENQVGAELFIRRKNALTLTAAGECFLEYIREAQQLNERYYQAFSNIVCMEKKVLRIGAGSITSPYLTQHVFPAFQKEYPNIQLKLVEDIHINLLQKLERGQVDLTLLIYTAEDMPRQLGTDTELVLRQPRLLSVGPSHPFCKLLQSPETNSMASPQRIRPELLQGQSVIVGVPGQKIWEDIWHLQKKYLIKGMSAIHSQNVDSGIAMAACGMGIYIAPAFYLAHSQVAKQEPLFYFYLDDPLLEWNLVIRYKDKKPANFMKRFTELTRQTFRMEDSDPSR